MMGAALVLLAVSALTARAGSGARTFYVDCGNGRDSSSGLSEEAPWKSLAKVSDHYFSPGDAVLLRRGTVCSGTLWPKGSGNAQAPIRLGAYGSGTRPRVEAGGGEEALKLFDQEYWDVESLDLSGGRVYGVFVSGKIGVLHHIHLRGLAVHDVDGPPTMKESGLIVVSPGSDEQSFDDVLVDGVSAWNSGQWAGILVGQTKFGAASESSHAVVRDSIVHDVQGDGIVLFRVRDGRIENSAAWNTGMQVKETIGTPNAVWTWKCRGCVVEGNEAFLTSSPGVDGGAFDIDYGDVDGVVADNYGHDTAGYCVAVFGSEGTTTSSAVRGNECIANGKSPRLAARQGAVYLHTWKGGILDGVAIEGNEIDWDPPGAAAALVCDATASRIRFKGNRLRSTSPLLIDVDAAAALEANRYILRGEGDFTWRFAGEAFDSFDGYRRASGQDAGGAATLHAAGGDGFWDDPPPPDGKPFDPATLKDARGRALTDAAGRWRLVSFLRSRPDGGSDFDDASRAQLVFLKSVRRQYGSGVLDVVLVLPANAQGLRDAARDWDIPESGLAWADGEEDSRTVLVTPQGRVAREWKGFVGPASLGPEIRRRLGPPNFSAPTFVSPTKK